MGRLQGTDPSLTPMARLSCGPRTVNGGKDDGVGKPQDQARESLWSRRPSLAFTAPPGAGVEVPLRNCVGALGRPGLELCPLGAHWGRLMCPGPRGWGRQHLVPCRHPRMCPTFPHLHERHCSLTVADPPAPPAPPLPPVCPIKLLVVART